MRPLRFGFGARTGRGQATCGVRRLASASIISDDYFNNLRPVLLHKSIWASINTGLKQTTSFLKARTIALAVGHISLVLLFAVVDTAFVACRSSAQQDF